MELEIKDCLRRPRDSKREREFLQRLRKLPEETRYDIVRQLLQQDKGIGLLMASSVLQQKRYFEKILEMGFQVGDASTILPWLECAVPKLGFHKVILALNNRLDSDPNAVDNALYWMSRFKPQNDPKADRVLEDIRTRQQKIADKRAALASNKALVGSSVNDAG